MHGVGEYTLRVATASLALAAQETEAAAETDGAARAEAPAAPAAPPAPAPPFWQRFIYQLFVMFFLTLMPWWTPNPRYM